MSEKHSELDDLMSQQRRIEEEDSDEESDSHDNHSEMIQFDAKVKAQARKIKGPFSDDSSDEEVSPQLFREPEPKQEPVNLVETIQGKIRWKEEKTDELEQLLKMGGDSAKDKKIRELAQRVKTINLALERQKTIRKKVEDQLNASMKANEVRAKQEQTHTPMSTTNKSIEKDDSQTMKPKLAEADKKIMEMRLLNQSMKNELNKALRVIAREVGEDVNLDQLLGEENAWKGRQQRIQRLKGRVKELEDKLHNNGVNVSQMSGFTAQTQQQIVSVPQANVNSLAETRRKQMQNLKVQVQALKGQNELLQGKVKSLTSRKLTLENEAKTIREQFQRKEKLLRQKSDNDDKYISLLKQENQKLKKEERVVTKLVYKGGSAPGDTDELPALKLNIEKLNAQVQKRDTRIKELTLALEQQQHVQVQRPRPSKEKLEEIQKQFLIDKKYDKDLSHNEEEALYRKWKEGKVKPSTKQ